MAPSNAPSSLRERGGKGENFRNQEQASESRHLDRAGKRENFHILVIRLSAMGDVAMTVPVLSALKHQYPQLKITVLTKPFFAPMFAQFGNVEVFAADVKGRHKGVFGLWNLYKELRTHDIDAVADLHNVLRSKVLKRYFKFAGIPFFQIDKGRAEKKALTAAKNKVFRPLKTTYQRYAEVFKELDFPITLSKAASLSQEKLSDKTIKLVGLKAEKGSGTSRKDPDIVKDGNKAAPYKDSGIRKKGSDATKWLGIAPFAAFEGKMYPLNLMEEVINKLDDTEKYKIFLFGGGKQEEKKLESLAAQFPSCVNVTGKLSFPEELALISNLDAMLSMDSGNGHLAAMYGIQVITIWGVTHPYAGFYPFDQDTDNTLLADRKKFPLIPTSVYGNKMPEGYEKAMETILPGAVFEKVEAVMNR